MGRGERLSEFARALERELRRLELKAQRAIVAVSGGSDSVALLLGLDELAKSGRLGFELIVAHLDHSLRPESGQEASRVAALATELGYECEIERIAVAQVAAEIKDNVEQVARRLRYEFLSKAARKHMAELIIVAHTMDDQAETVLLRLIRGSGAEGLSGMARTRALGPGLWLVRPLLGWARKRDTEAYCRARRVEFVVDAWNEDERFARVRVRRQLIPLLETFNPKIVETLSRTADLLREDDAALDEEAERWLNRAGCEDQTAALRVEIVKEAPAAIRRRVLRRWIEINRGHLRRIELVHIEAVEKLLEGERGGRVAELPGGAEIERRRGLLYFRQKEVEKGAMEI